MAFHHIVGNSEPYNAQKWHEYDQYTRQIIQGLLLLLWVWYDMDVLFWNILVSNANLLTPLYLYWPTDMPHVHFWLLLV